MENQLLSTGGVLTANNNSIICTFPSARLILSTSAYNGGYLMVDAVFNHRLSFFVNSEAELPGGSMEEYLALVAVDHGLKQEAASGLLTNANMRCRGYSVNKHRDLIVEVVATAGVNANAARAGDPACYHEDNGRYCQVGGTINILAFTNTKLSLGAMAKALISITEAKTATLQELMVVSPFTLNPATGTGTDGIIIASDPTAKFTCTDTGTQSKLGELFCLATKTAIALALSRECNIDPLRQGTVKERLTRLGFDEKHDPTLPLAPAKSNLLLAISQSVWYEYCWGLIGMDEMQQLFMLLETPLLQPLGLTIATILRQKLILHKTQITDRRQNKWNS